MCVRRCVRLLVLLLMLSVMRMLSVLVMLVRGNGGVNGGERHEASHARDAVPIARKSRRWLGRRRGPSTAGAGAGVIGGVERGCALVGRRVGTHRL